MAEVSAPDFSGDIIRLRRWLMFMALLTLLGAFTGVGYFVYGNVFGPVSDLVSVLLGFSLYPLVSEFYRIGPEAQTGIKLTEFIIGTVAVILMIAGSAVLVLYGMGLDQLPAGIALGLQFTAIFFQGVWLILVGIHLRNTGEFSAGTIRVGLVAGTGYILFGVSSPFGSDSPAASIGALIGLIAFVYWAFRIRKELSRTV